MQKTDEECVKRLKDGRLRVRVTATCPRTGKRLEAQRTLKHGQKMPDALALKEELQERLRTKGKTEEAPLQKDRISTVSDYAERWLERKARRRKPSTVHEYERHLYSKILPHIGHIFISRLVRRDVADWVAWCEQATFTQGKGEDLEILLYSTATLKGWWRTMRCLLKDACADGYLDRDLTERIDPPNSGVSGRRESQTLSIKALGRLVKAAEQFAPGRYCEIVTLAYTGMRAGELWALEWKDIDLEEGQILVMQSVWRGEVTSTKTHAPREVPLPELVTEALRCHRDERIEQGDSCEGRELVFPSDTGEHRHNGSLRKTFSKLCEHLGFDILVGPQVLRRTFNTLLMEAKTDRIVQRAIMGHSSEQMTERYSGVRMDMKRAAVDKIIPLAPRRKAAESSDAGEADVDGVLSALIASGNAGAIVQALKDQGVDTDELVRQAAELTTPGAGEGGG